MGVSEDLVSKILLSLDILLASFRSLGISVNKEDVEVFCKQKHSNPNLKLTKINKLNIYINISQLSIDIYLFFRIIQINKNDLSLKIIKLETQFCKESNYGNSILGKRQ